MIDNSFFSASTNTTLIYFPTPNAFMFFTHDIQVTEFMGNKEKEN